MSRLLEALHSGRVLLMDGAMGTELQRLGLADGEPAELWNITHPEQVMSVHRAYHDAGAELFTANTFLAYPPRIWDYSCHTNESRVPHFAYPDAAESYTEQIWQAAIDQSREATGAAMVLADVGPGVRRLPPNRWGRRMLVAYCATDGLLCETWTPENWCVCLEWLGGIGSPVDVGSPVLVSFTYMNSGAVTDLIVSAKKCAGIARRDGVTALGANCGRDIDMDDLLEIIRVYREHSDLPLFVRPNAGTPTRTASGWVYPRSPEYMADKLWPLLEVGVTMVGGCCGTTPAHIAAFRRVVDAWNAKRTAKR